MRIRVLARRNQAFPVVQILGTVLILSSLALGKVALIIKRERKKKSHSWNLLAADLLLYL